MKILLIGEFSGLHVNLKEGLIALGHDVCLASYSDGYKKVPGADISFDRRTGGILGRIDHALKPFLNLRNLCGFDIVQFISIKVFNPRLGINSALIKMIIKNNSRAFLIGAGCDAFLWQHARQKLRYGWFEDTLKYDAKRHSHEFESESWLDWNKEMLELVDGYIPVAYEYQVGYENHPKLRKGLPMPINSNNIQFKIGSPTNDRLSVIHGLSRYGFKGTRFVESSFKYLTERYSDRADFNIFGHLPLEQYLALTSKADVMVDQLWSHSTGMNALYGLAQGKVVLSGAELESLDFLNIEYSPVINVKPSSQDLCGRLEEIINLSTDELLELKVAGRNFVENVHGHINVAQQFLDEWTAI